MSNESISKEANSAIDNMYMPDWISISFSILVLALFVVVFVFL